jgi:hypothetical protein
MQRHEVALVKHERREWNKKSATKNSPHICRNSHASRGKRATQK